MSRLTTNVERRMRPAEVTLSKGEIAVVESHHSVDFEMDVGVWPFRKICWVAVGRGKLEANEGASSIEKGDFMLLPSNWPHRFIDDPKEPLTLVIICVAESLFDVSSSGWQVLWNAAMAEDSLGSPLRARTAFHQVGLVELVRRALREYKHQRLGWFAAMHATVSDLLVRFGRGQCEASRGRGNRSERAVAAAIEYVDEHPYLPLRIDDMATRCQLSARRFTDLFKTQSGHTFNQYLLGKRVEYASQRLRETGHILYACYESGFNDPAYFYRVFKKHSGKTPGQYLKSVMSVDA